MMVEVVNYLCLLSNVWARVDLLLHNIVPLAALIALPALLVTALIPLAIFLLDKSEAGIPWDKVVILKKVISATALFWSIVIMAILPLLWGVNGLRPLIALLMIVGCIFLVNAVISAYKWLIVTEGGNKIIPSYRLRKRVEYLESLSSSEREVIWSLTWNGMPGIRGLIDERVLIKVFIKDVESSRNCNNRTSANLLQELISNLPNVDISDPIIHEELIRASLTWTKSFTRTNNSDRPEFVYASERLFNLIIERDIKSSFGTFLLFDDVKKYYTKNPGVHELTFANRFSQTFLTNLEVDSDYVWDEFPQEWKITLANLSVKDWRKNIPELWLNSYLSWLMKRNLLASTNGGSVEYDSLADDVTKNLLPNVEIGLWSDLIAFHWSSYGVREGETNEHAQIRGFIEREKRFGLVGKMYGFWEYVDEGSFVEKYQAQRSFEFNETIQLAVVTNAFPLLLNRNSLDKLIAETGNFDFNKGTREYDKLARLKAIFTSIREKQNDNPIRTSA